jgi:hypothetical protein
MSVGTWGAYDDDWRKKQAAVETISMKVNALQLVTKKTSKANARRWSPQEAD